MADKCQFSGFIEEGKVCQHPAFQNSEYCYWHDPDIPKSEEFVRSALENVIKATSGDLEGYVLKRANLEGMNLSNVNLKDADLSGCNVNGVNFTGSDMRGVKMNNTSAIGADFENANLMTANLSSGNFTNANFKNTNFRIVLVENAIMDGAVFDGSDRRHTTMFMGMPASAEATAPAPAQPQMTEDMATAQTVLNADYAASPTVLNADYNESDALFDESELQADTAPQPEVQQQPQVQAEPQIQSQPQIQPEPQIQPQGPIIAGGGGMSTGKIIGIAAAITVGAVVLLVLLFALMNNNGKENTGNNGTAAVTTGTGEKTTRSSKLSDRMAALEEKIDNSVILKKGDLDQALTIEKVKKAVEFQEKLTQELMTAREEGDKLRKKIDVDKEEFEKTLAGFQTQLDKTLSLKKEVDEKLAKVSGEYDTVRKQMTDQELALTKQITALEQKLKDTETKMNETAGAKGNFAGIIEELRETNDELVKNYEKKIAEYKAKVAKLSQWYEKDKEFSEEKFNHFLVNWERYTVVGSPFSDYVVGVKFTPLASKKVRSDIFILGVEGASQPAFKILVFDGEGKKIDGDLKTMMSQTISKGNIFTAKKDLDIDAKQLRYFTVDFVQ